MAESDDLLAIRAGLIAALAAEAINPQPSYSINGQSVDYNGYRTSMLEQISKVNELIATIQGPYEVVHEGIL